jgi:riboflavin kinase / FMN adenylyltransferase
MHDLLPNVPSVLQGSCISLGNFDGVHVGHRKMLTELIELGRKSGASTVAVTFDPHPLSILRPASSPPLLTTMDQRGKLLTAAGVDHVYCIPVTRRLLQMTASEFFFSVLVDRFGIHGIVEGPNFMFGRDRAGNVATLRDLCPAANIKFQVVNLAQTGGAEYSSSRIRRYLQMGDVTHAATLLGRNYTITGTVERGDGRGKALGFPTANLGNIPTLVPAFGVYACSATIDGRTFPAAVNIGPNPTFDTEVRKVECHMIGLADTLYDRDVTLAFHRRLRATQRFDSVAELTAQIGEDVALCTNEIDAESIQPNSQPNLTTINDAL